SPTGTVTFFLCQPNEVTAAGCPSGAGTQVGAHPVALSARAASTARSRTTNAIGKYCWRAEYSGDGFYNPSSHTNANTGTNGECFVTVKQSSSTATQPSPSGATEVPGLSASDTATVSGGAGDPTPPGAATL